ncbi:MAG: sodium:proton antiporter [Clostridiales Family XIII bacterium]|jgi:CPA1 family monovalent cation:H+ antiporter|nr:sodium:proton antiporter [Clostridiales Family XIII bacterium]
MEITAVIIGVLFAIVLSNILGSLFPMLPLTLIQIIFGCMMALLTPEFKLYLEPELFMILVIAPLLFREADEADVYSLWELRKTVFLMAFILVFITVFAVGGAVNLLIPGIPVAACFALGAILGPTDAVAVFSLSARIKIHENLKNALKGEGLINDASGLIAFRFAVAALLTGGFSFYMAFRDLLLASLGGVLVGFVLSSVERWAVDMLKRLSVRSTGAYMLIEIMMPFICYMFAEEFGMSGVLAAVAAGVRQTPSLRKADPSEAEFGIAKKVTWDMITFTLNSLVFLLLGLQLPGIFTDVWNDPDYSHFFPVLCAAVVTLILFGVRFLSLAVFATDVVGDTLRVKLKNTLLLTLSGVKGAVSLATAFALPLYYGDGLLFPYRSLLLFITAGAIILSLLMALILLPIIADSIKRDRSACDMQIAILREVIAQLKEQFYGKADNAKNTAARAVIKNYKERIRGIEDAEYDRREKKAVRALWRFMYRTENRIVEESREKAEIDADLCRDVRDLLFFIYSDRLRGAAAHAMLSFFFSRFGGGRRMRRLFADEHRLAVREQLVKNAVLLSKALRAGRGDLPERLADRMLQERFSKGAEAENGLFGRTLRDRLQPGYEDALISGFYVERRVIHQFLERGDISIEQANTLRGDVNRLELYTLSEKHGNAAPPIVERLTKLREKMQKRGSRGRAKRERLPRDV